MGLPSGTLWARKNMDASRPDHFAESDMQYLGSFVSWANVDPHNPVSPDSFGDWTWGSSTTWVPYVTTPGHLVTTDIDFAHDAARSVCGFHWRLPSSDDFLELINPSYTDFIDGDGVVIDPSAEDKRIEIEGVQGVRIRSKVNGNILFFACCGDGYLTSWERVGSVGFYWCKDLNTAELANCFRINASPGCVGDQRFRGFAIRPVIKL